MPTNWFSGQNRGGLVKNLRIDAWRRAVTFYVRTTYIMQLFNTFYHTDSSNPPKGRRLSMQQSITLICKCSAGGFGLLVQFSSRFMMCWKFSEFLLLLLLFFKVSRFVGEIRNTSKSFLSSQMTKTSGGFAFRTPILSWHPPFKLLFLPNTVNFHSWCDAKMLHVWVCNQGKPKEDWKEGTNHPTSSTSRCHLSKFKFLFRKWTFYLNVSKCKKAEKYELQKKEKRTKSFVEVQVKQIWANRTCHDILISN